MHGAAQTGRVQTTAQAGAAEDGNMSVGHLAISRHFFQITESLAAGFCR
jgi:hypothetical protein